MPHYEASPDYQHGVPENLGVLLVNTGTPDAPTPEAVRRFLKAFLSDPRVVEIPRPIWWLILNGYILRVRPHQSAAAYRRIWTDQGSPLLIHSQDIAAGVRATISSHLPGDIPVELALSYGNPSIEAAFQKLHARFVRRLLVLPLYPQYSGATTGSVFDAVTRSLGQRRWVPELRFINHYHDARGYISAVAGSLREFWDREGRGDRLLISFHGVPRRSLDLGDPYHCHCQKTARLLAESLNLDDDFWQVAFQSRLGRAEWLRPYTDETIKAWGRERLGKIDVVCPGFAADCLETLEEVAIRYAADYAEAGGGELRYIPALNGRDEHVDFLSQLIQTNTAGWIEEPYDLEQSLQRARQMGAAR